MAGTLNLALAQQIDVNGQPLSGCLLYFFAVGTVATLQNSYQDYGLSIVNPNPLVADQYGRIPMFYLADGQVHVRLTDANGVVIFDYPSMQVIGPSSGGGGGGGGSVDPTTIASTGDIKFRATPETLSGWLKMNAQTIGGATSGASQRANVDTQNLFVYLWNNYTQSHCPVTGGRGVSGLADFNANKVIQMPDWRSRGPIGLDDMGNTPAGILQASNVTSGGGDGVTTPAASGGEANHTLALTEIPAHNHSVTLYDPGHLHSQGSTGADSSAGGAPPGGTGFANTGTSVTGVTVSESTVGGGLTHNNMSPFSLGTWYMKQ